MAPACCLRKGCPGSCGPTTNPTPRMRGYDKEETAERPVGSVSAVIALSDLIERRYRALVLFAAFTGLRWGEIVALASVTSILIREQSAWRARFAELWDGRRVARSARNRQPVCALLRCLPF